MTDITDEPRETDLIAMIHSLSIQEVYSTLQSNRCLGRNQQQTLLSLLVW